jgi:predicted secreted protein
MNIRTLLLATLLVAAVTGAAAEPPAKSAGTLIDFRVDVQKSVPNDLGRATAFVEISGTDTNDVAGKVKTVIAAALTTAKAQAGITVKSGATHTYPVYGKGGRSIESWRMRSELVLESRDATALSTAIGKLQGTLAVSNISFTPAPDTRRKAEDETTSEAIDAFKAKAERIAGAMKKPYRIRQMSLNGSGNFPQPMPMLRATAMMADAAPMPVEAGESNVTVGINGQIELLE